MTCLGQSWKILKSQSEAFFLAWVEYWSLIQSVGIVSQVSHAADTARVTYREEPTDYFPGVTDASSSKSIPRVREGVYPVSNVGQSGSASGEEHDLSTSDAGQSCSKRQRLDSS